MHLLAGYSPALQGKAVFYFTNENTPVVLSEDKNQTGDKSLKKENVLKKWLMVHFLRPSIAGRLFYRKATTRAFGNRFKKDFIKQRRETNGRASGTCEGLLVLHLAPEAAVAGPIAALQDGDIIDIDVVKRSISVQLSEKELSDRLKDWHAPPRRKKGFLAIYQKLVQQADQGAVLTTDD